MVRNRPRPWALTEVKGLRILRDSSARTRAKSTMTSLATHPQRNSIRLQLRQQPVLQRLSPAQWAEIEPQLGVVDYRKGDPLVRQGDDEMEQFFILEGMLEARGVESPRARR